jgi:hypothetical protein
VSAGRTQIGSYEGQVQTGDDLLELIFEDIEHKTGMQVTKKALRHVTIISDEGNRFEINGFPFEILNNMFCTPSNGNADLMLIESFKPLQDCVVQINYIR